MRKLPSFFLSLFFLYLQPRPRPRRGERDGSSMKYVLLRKLESPLTLLPIRHKRHKTRSKFTVQYCTVPAVTLHTFFKYKAPPPKMKTPPNR
jgi:hypothetical protein